MVHHIAARKRIGGSKEFSFAIPKRLLEQYLPTTEFFYGGQRSRKDSELLRH
jgi:hypothetical protein